MNDGGHRVAITEHRNGRTLSCVCEWMTERGYEGLHTYRITVEKRRSGFCDYMLLLVGVICSSLAVSAAGESLASSLPLPFLGICIIILVRRRRVEQEAVVVIPTLGIQLETVYCSRRVDRRFFSLDRILVPIINEAVTPVTSYFYLALILREEKYLVLAFPHLRPSLTMLSSVWRSIHEALGTETSKILPPRTDWVKECWKN